MHKNISIYEILEFALKIWIIIDNISGDLIFLELEQLEILKKNSWSANILGVNKSKLNLLGVEQNEKS